MQRQSGNNPRAQSQRELGARAALALQQSIRNPYASIPVFQSNPWTPVPQRTPHFPPQTFTSDGYALSSTYNPSLQHSYSQQYAPLPTAAQPSTDHTGQRAPVSNPNSTWLTRGNHRCTYQGCKFTASAQSVEIHMMDRHLIYPAHWDKKKQQNTWDGDPSFKGFGYTDFTR
jgi:hypothetical protein